MKGRKPNRLHNFDYASDNLYYVTSCVNYRTCCFGEIVIDNDGIAKKMILNEYGEIAEKQWYWLEKQFPYVILHEFVVMPNHIHGIIEICRRRDRSRPVPTSTSRSIPASFAWQRSFHEHIIRDQNDYERISEYILDNPSNWTIDELNDQ